MPVRFLEISVCISISLSTYDFMKEGVDSKHMLPILLGKIPKTSDNCPGHTLELSAFSSPGIPAKFNKSFSF